jgi:hypothetical protein
MPWNLRLLRHSAPSPASDVPSPSREDISPAARAQVLGVFRRLAAVLQLTAQLAESAGKSERHAAFEARLAIFRARFEAGDTGPRLAMALAEFGKEFEAFISGELGCRRA